MAVVLVANAAQNEIIITLCVHILGERCLFISPRKLFHAVITYQLITCNSIPMMYIIITVLYILGHSPIITSFDKLLSTIQCVAFSAEVDHEVVEASQSIAPKPRNGKMSTSMRVAVSIITYLHTLMLP